MGQIDQIFRSEALDPEMLLSLADSYDRAIAVLRQTGELRGDIDAISELVAKRIVDLAGRGERDLQRLTIGALKFVRASQVLEFCYSGLPERR
jgi:hypothetical protein